MTNDPLVVRHEQDMDVETFYKHMDKRHPTPDGGPHEIQPGNEELESITRAFHEGFHRINPFLDHTHAEQE